MSDERQLWERQPYDTPEAWVAFKDYRDQVPPRRQRATTNAPAAQVYRWYSDNFWKSRVEALDAHMDKTMLEEKEAIWRQSARDVAIEHMQMLGSARAIALRELAEMRQRPPGSFRPADLTKLMEIVVKYDRLVRGESTEQIATVQLENFSDEQLREYDALNRLAADAEVKSPTLQ